MIYLCCESSTLLGSVAVFKDEQLLFFKESHRQGSHSDVLNVFVKQVLAEAELALSQVDLFVAGVGPGSFTGIRISLNAIKTFAFCFDKPVLGIDSLQNLASQQSGAKLPIVAMINAYKNMVYIGTYKFVGSELITAREPSVVRVQNLENYLTEKSIVVGDGYMAYSKYFSEPLSNLIVRPEAASDNPTAQKMGFLIQRNAKKETHWSQLLPVYLRSSEAEENQQGIKYQPLE